MTPSVRLSVAVQTIHGAPHLVLHNVGDEIARDLVLFLRDVESHQDWTGLLSRPRCWMLPAGQQTEFRLAPHGPRMLEVEVIYYGRAGVRGFWLSTIERAPERNGTSSAEQAARTPARS